MRPDLWREFWKQANAFRAKTPMWMVVYWQLVALA